MPNDYKRLKKRPLEHTFFNQMHEKTTNNTKQLKEGDEKFPETHKENTKKHNITTKGCKMTTIK